MATLAADTNPLAAAAAPDRPAPAAPAADRHEALDVVRGAALFGILLMNIVGMGLPHAYYNPLNAGGAEGANLWAWIIAMVGFEGTQRALFSILFGAGVILLTGRLEAAGRTDSADIYMRRNMWLVAFGLFNAYVLLWGGDILFFYGVIGLFLFAVRKMAAKALLAAGLAALLAATAWNVSDTAATLRMHDAHAGAVAARGSGARLVEEQTKAIESWKERVAERRPSAADQRREIEERTAGYGSAFLAQAAENNEGLASELFRYFFETIGMMLLGMALFKLGVLTLERPTRLYLAMVAIGYGLGLAVNIAEVSWIRGHNFSTLAFAQAEATYDAGRLAMTMGHLGALLLFVRSGAASPLRRGLASVGRMAFTNYLTHSAIALVLFVGFGLFGQLERHQLFYIVFAIWAFQLVASTLWLRRYRFGPLEWLWRYLTYLERPPFRRSDGAAAAAVPA
ncbi:MAG TPA: DUF418 domain-containing protein [Allosphingosinicella sp.]